MPPTLMDIPAGLAVPGSEHWPFVALVDAAEVAPGTMRRVSRGDLDLLVAHTPAGLCVIDDRCPHMAAPLSVGALDECIVACPLHRGRFDLRTGDVVEFPTTGGLDADGGYHAPWAPPGGQKRADDAIDKARARALTRVRRIRYYPLRVSGGMIEARLPL